MKTLTKTFFATVASIFLIGSTMTSSAAVHSNTDEMVVHTIQSGSSVTGVNRLWASGNVKVVLTQNEKESIKGGLNFNPETTFIQRKGSTLYINSVESSEVTVYVTLKDLHRVEAAGSANVVTSNNFDVKHLQVFLSQDARAKISAMSASLYTVVSEDAVLKMSGSTDEHTLIASNMKNVKLNSFSSLSTSSRPTDYAALKANKLIANRLK
jgi:hypothetical protein